MALTAFRLPTKIAVNKFNINNKLFTKINKKKGENFVDSLGVLNILLPPQLHDAGRLGPKFISFLDSLVFQILVRFLLFQISSFKFPIWFGLGFLFKQGIFILLCLGFSK